MDLNVSLVQTTLAWEDPEANHHHLQSLLAPLRGNTELIVLPEMFSSGFTMNPGNLPAEAAAGTLEWMRAQASGTGAALAGSLVWPEDGSYFNRFVFMEPDGTCHTYDKRHTFTLSGEDKVYERGSRNVRIRYRGFTISPQVCYDLRFPVWSRNTDDYDVLIYVANWPETRVAAWDTLLRARAIENMAFVVGVNRLGSDPNGLKYNGHSAGYDCMGNTLGYSESEGVIQIDLNRDQLLKTRAELRFLQDRDDFTPGW